MNRRDLVTIGPAVLAALALPTAALASASESPLRKLFREWAEVQRAANEAPSEMPEEEFVALIKKACDLDRQIMALPAADASEWMLKLIAWTDYGAHELQSRGDNPAIWDEARLLTGSAT